MTTPHPTPFSATTPRAGVFTPFVIVSDSDDEITTLPIKPAPPSPDRTPALYGYPLDFGDDSSDEDLSDTAESLHTQPSNKKGYAGNLPLCNNCKFHHTGSCVTKCGNCKRFGHQTRDFRSPVLRPKQRPSVAKQIAEVTCHECGMLGHYKNDFPIWRCQNRVNKYWKEKAHGDSSVVANNVDV
ncbi:hypothetical protein Tco_0873627 [Tanacetum coccineum]|uniref:CCHC-type domain-containing protein n=1 Tax=Tanacetum coccineum TaxID=301880 RepID=A0ABQ5BJR5_9ASTR